MIAESVAHLFHGLVEHSRKLMQPGQIIFVILHTAERRIERQGSVSQVNTAELRRRHLPVSKFCCVECFS